MREAEDRRRQRRRHVPIREVENQQPAQHRARPALHVERRQPIGLERGEHAEERRDDEHPAQGRRPDSLHQIHYLVCSADPSRQESGESGTSPAVPVTGFRPSAIDTHAVRPCHQAVGPECHNAAYCCRYSAASTISVASSWNLPAGEGGDGLGDPRLQGRRAAGAMLDGQVDQAVFAELLVRPSLRASVMPSVNSTRRSPLPTWMRSWPVGGVGKHAEDRAAGRRDARRARRRAPGPAGSGRRWRRSACPSSESTTQ